MIEFVLNGRAEKIDQADPNQSILEWLRTKKRLTGTKEGCGSGDCGACTVITGAPDKNGQIRYEAINSCITLIGSLQGKHLLTIEAFREQPAHPVQQSLMDCHGAQCGFCTPGIVMSLIALHSESAPGDADDHKLMEALAGNLCRCTGYRPIMEAGRQALVQSWQPGSDNHPARYLARADKADGLATVDDTSMTSLEARNGNQYYAPAALPQLKRLLRAHPDARLIAGGTDLVLEITQQLKTLPKLISLERVRELNGCQLEENHLVIGAATPYRQFHSQLSGLWPAFDHLLERLGSLQVRNRGTLGGNIANASPIGDMPPALIALDATLELEGPEGARELPAEQFFKGYRQTDLQPGEFIHSIHIPVPEPNQRLFIYKVSKRLDDDISAVLGAFRLTLRNGVVQDCRLAYGGMAATPARARLTEAALLGKPWNQRSVEQAIKALSDDFSPLTDVRASSAYRLQVAGNLLYRALLENSDLHHRDTPLMVTDYA